MTLYSLQSIPDAPVTATADKSGDKSPATISETKLCRTVLAETFLAASYNAHYLSN